MRLITTTAIFIFCFHGLAFSQQDELGNWIMYFGTNKINENYSIHTEVQYRNHTAVPNNIEQLLLRTGLNYHVSPSTILTLGYGFIPSFVFESEQSEPEVVEHRIFQQLILKNRLYRLQFEHRYRIEQRWVNEDYRNRLRYRLMLTVPVNKPVIEQGSLFVGLYDEIFMNTKETFFDRNRLYGAIGYQFHKTASAQVGMLYQRVNDFGKWYLQFAVFFNPNLKKD